MTSRSLGARLRLAVVLSIAVAAVAFVPSVSAASPADFHLSKTCSGDGDATVCVVQSSNVAAIPAGTPITYHWPSAVLAFPTITVAGGAATGSCRWSHPVGSIWATCTFGHGTGTLAGFHLSVAVTFDGSTWFWDGTYWFNGSD